MVESYSATPTTIPIASAGCHDDGMDALFVALIAGVFALGGSLLGARLSRGHWLRTERRVACTEFLLRVDSSLRAHRAVSLGGPEPEEGVFPWSSASASIVVLGPKRLVDAAEKVALHMVMEQTALISHDLPYDFNLVIDAREEFVRVARSVLKSNS